MKKSEDVSKCLTGEDTKKNITTPLEKKGTNTLITVKQKTCKTDFFFREKCINWKL